MLAGHQLRGLVPLQAGDGAVLVLRFHQIARALRIGKRLPRERDAQSMPPRGHEQAVPLQTPRAPAPVDRPAFTPRDNGAVQGRERQEDARSMHERPWQAPVQQRPQSEAAPRPPQQQPPRMAQPQQVPQARPEFNNRPPQQERGQAPSAAPRERPAPRGGPRNLDDLH